MVFEPAQPWLHPQAAFLDPLKDRMALEVMVEVFSKSDTDFMAMFTGEGAWGSGTDFVR